MAGGLEDEWRDGIRDVVCDGWCCAGCGLRS